MSRNVRIKIKKINNNSSQRELKLVSFVSFTLATLLIRMLLKWKNIQDNNYATLAAMLQKRNDFLLTLSRKTKISVIGPAQLLIHARTNRVSTYFNFFSHSLDYTCSIACEDRRTNSLLR